MSFNQRVIKHELRCKILLKSLVEVQRITMMREKGEKEDAKSRITLVVNLIIIDALINFQNKSELDH